MIKPLQLLTLVLLITSCHAQPTEKKTSDVQDIDQTPPIYYGMPKVMDAQDTSAGWRQAGQKILLTGTVYKSDAKTPASDVVIYYYHTNMDGEYVHKKEVAKSLPMNSMGLTHGYIRGWLKTGSDGKYAIYTVRPGTYPSRGEPAHIHVNIKEPDLEAHYLVDDFVFDDDRLLTGERRKKMENRGGSGVMRLVQKGDLHIGERNIILGLHIPDYSKATPDKVKSGKGIGEDIISFTPYHAWGPDKGSKTCPICKYGWYQGILYFVGNKPNWKEIKQWLAFLERESQVREKYLKVYFVYGNEDQYDQQDRIKTLEKLGDELNLEKVALTFVPSFSDETSSIYLNKLDPSLENTFLLYKRSNIFDKYINLKPTPENFKMLATRLDESVNEYFDLPRPKKE